MTVSSSLTLELRKGANNGNVNTLDTNIQIQQVFQKDYQHQKFLTI